jgi:hypothetical protein
VTLGQQQAAATRDIAGLEGERAVAGAALLEVVGCAVEVEQDHAGDEALGEAVGADLVVAGQPGLLEVGDDPSTHHRCGSRVHVAHRGHMTGLGVSAQQGPGVLGLGLEPHTGREGALHRGEASEELVGEGGDELYALGEGAGKPVEIADGETPSSASRVRMVRSANPRSS